MSARAWAILTATCLLLAFATLLGPSEPTYDPMAWILWGREILHGNLDTVSGPSWKPLPVLFTIPFALAGSSAPALWLVIARTGGFLAVALAYRLGWRVRGHVAGAIAALAVILSSGFVHTFWRGNSEGTLVAVCLAAAEAHASGRRRLVLLLGVAAGLMRPEVWPFLALYGLWFVRRGTRRDRTLVLVLGGFTALVWFAPEYLGSGNFLRAASRARQPTLDSPALAAQPWLEVLRQASHLVALPVLALAAVEVGLDRRRRSVLALAGAALILLVAVAAMTELGFAGNLRYVELPIALVCVLAGAGVVSVVTRARRLGGPVLAVAAALGLAAVCAPGTRAMLEDLDAGRQLVVDEATRSAAITTAVARGGGRDFVNTCGAVFTDRFTVPRVAWELHRHLEDVEIFPFPPATVFALQGSAMAGDHRFARVGTAGPWVIRRSCS